MSGQKLKAWEAPRAEDGHPATLRGSLVVFADIRSNHPSSEVEELRLYLEIKINCIHTDTQTRFEN